MASLLTAAQAHLRRLVARGRLSFRAVAPPINIDDLADREDRAALAADLADKAAGRDGTSLDELDAALDRINAETLS